MRKGGVMRIKDYFSAVGSKPLVFGLAWDVTDGVNIDLDASAIMLSQNGAQLALVDLVYFGKLRSSDGSIQHCGDQRTGAAAGDDEQIVLNLQSVHPTVFAIGIVINSYSGQELDDVAGCSCHLFDPSTGRDVRRRRPPRTVRRQLGTPSTRPPHPRPAHPALRSCAARAFGHPLPAPRHNSLPPTPLPPRAAQVAQYKLTGVRALDKKTALLMACLHRDPANGEWAMRIVSEPTQGRTAQANVGDLINWLKMHPAAALPATAPGGARMLARTPTASAAMMAAHPSGRIVGDFNNPTVQLGQVPEAGVVQGSVVMAQPVVPMGQAVPMGTPM